MNRICTYRFPTPCFHCFCFKCPINRSNKLTNSLGIYNKHKQKNKGSRHKYKIHVPRSTSYNTERNNNNKKTTMKEFAKYTSTHVHYGTTFTHLKSFAALSYNKGLRTPLILSSSFQYT